MAKNTFEKYPVTVSVPNSKKLASPSLDSIRSNRISGSPKGALIVTIFAGALFATFVSPQLGLLGRGLRSSLPLFLLLLGFIVLLTHKRAWQKIRIHLFSTFLGIVFLLYGVIQNLLQPDPAVFHAQVFSVAICIMIWIAITLLRSLFPSSLESVRWIVLIVFSVSLGVGIPLLLQQPGIARLTAGGNPLNPYNDTALYLKGVGNYTWYTPIAIAWPAIANWIINRPKNRFAKMIAWGLLLTLSATVLFSTFTMAFVILCLSIVLWLILNILTDLSWRNRWVVMMGLVILFLSFPSLYNLSLSSDVTMFATSKATRLIEGTLSRELVSADQSGRIIMLDREMETFFKNPIFGAWGFDTSRYFVGGHSSWGDTLALQGVFGLSLWLGFLAPSWFRRKQPLSVSAGTAGGTLSWTLLGLGGILNPTFNSIVGLLLIWLFDEGGVWQTQKANTLSENSRMPFLGRK